MNPTDAVSIRPCTSQEDMKQCVELQRLIWNFSDEDVVPAAIFSVALHTGGHAYCAWDGDRAVGFALAFSASHDESLHWHSHMVGVLPEYQNRGVGRRLKLHQRDEALRFGIPVIEWTYDPLELRNAWFNIAKLGAIVRRYIPDCYGSSSSPLHGGLPTDRFVAEWHVASGRVRDILNGSPVTPAAHSIEIPIPVSIRQWRTSDPPRAAAVQTNLREKCLELFASGYAVTGFRKDADKGVYILERYEN